MADTPSSRPPPLPPIRHCTACDAAVLDGEKRCSHCGYTTADPIPPFNLHVWMTSNPVHTVDDPPRRKTPSGFPLPALPNPFAGLPVPPISQETLRAARSPAERLAAASRIKAGLHAAAERDFVRIATQPALHWWLGPVRSRDRYKRRELFHHAAACVATLALGALFAIGLFGWFAK